jgi:hypothetical protein
MMMQMEETTCDQFTCTACWFNREVDFAVDAGAWTVELTDGYLALLGGILPGAGIESLAFFRDHSNIRPEAMELLADAAEFIACYRDRTLTPQRPEVIAALSRAW